MSRLIRFLTVLKNNPKKSIFFSGLGTIGFNFFKGKYEDEQLMRAYCEEALKFGDEIQHLSDKDRHITVILNPAANEGKARNQFDKYCSPLLHLAGLKVALVKTEHEGQARDYMKIMENTSAVVVAGGDGTLAEVVTGLMRRRDQSTVVKQLPLGLLPLGRKNNTASAIFGFNNTPEVKHFAEATMSIIKNVKRPIDVMEVLPLTSNSDESPKPVYSVSEIEWSAFRDAEERKDKYWYYPFIKKYLTYVFSTYKDINWKCNADLEYILPCDGCSNCYNPTKPNVNPSVPSHQQRWWQAFLPKFNVQRVKEKDEDDDFVEVDRSSVINNECGQLHETSIKDICDVRIFTNNLKSNVNEEHHSISIKMGVENITSLDFIKEGWSRVWNKQANHSKELIVGEVTLRPHEDVLKDKIGNDRELNIDNESFEVRPMKIKVCRRAIKVFAPPLIPDVV